ncbi:hypothetical protein J2X85_002341 [Microbacterium trichothecenolyticum]|uniref:hypothetical protein n=1 Tax=Microbacterium trichothecenolyticum TaxID=69370 RepID=UPI002861EA33|nr:hypothetical protein [Microbacterium trichothecenolyticum]MDR7185307.1 hypothetical protein [Microbacterium trichothecenolyticum]
MAAGYRGERRAPARRRVGVFAMVVSLVAALLLAPGVASATQTERVEPTAVEAAATGIVKTADLSQFQPGNIISDAKFFDRGTMTEAQIQQFLEARLPRCSAGYTCLRDYSDTSRSTAADAMCGAYSGGVAERASTIIFKVSQACGINPQVILVMLQKEQGLVLSSAPTKDHYRAAMGQGCPDTAACDARYYGFFNQVFGAAWQLKRYANPPGTSQYFTWYAPGKTWNVRWHPNEACGSSPVYIQNQATANLYYYTPYQPNAAAIRAGYNASSDPCASYGNRNFFQFFTDWFGSTQSYNSPFGNVELIRALPGEFEVAGWAADLDTKEPISVHVYVGSVGVAVNADQERPDVGAAYPAVGSRHGFGVRIPAPGAGLFDVCVYGINAGGGSNVMMRCQTVTAMSGSPTGALESVRPVDGGVEVSGWAIDPDTVAPATVHVYVDSVGTALAADKERADLATRFPAYGTKHGFATKLTAAPGSHTVCAYGINVAAGGNVQLGCQTVVVPGSAGQIPELGRAPIGVFEALTLSGSTAVASGWAIDPDTASSIKVHIYVGGTGVEYTADAARADVARIYPAYGERHGFVQQLNLPPGKSEVCAYAINTGSGGHTFLGCRSAEVAVQIADLGRAPIGVFEGLTVSGSTAVASGWAIDPDTTSSIKVHIYVAGKGVEYTADAPRADVARIYPTYGEKHGFGQQLTLPVGRSDVCAYAINTGAGGHTFLGCRTAEVAVQTPDLGRPPFGNFESAAPAPGGATVSGWALDPDTTQPISVHIYVDSTSAAYTADKPRADVAAAYGLGDRHGFSEFIPMTSGSHTVCVYPINTGPGGHSWLGCRTITVP